VRLAQAVNGAATRYVNDVAAPLPQVLRESADQRVSEYLYGLGMIGSYDSGNWAYHHPDGLGSVRQLSDGDGQVTLAQAYTPFGAPLTQAGTPQGSFGFAGEQHDPAAGLTFLRARYYDPSTGRFLTRDPYPAYASVPSTLHRYAYVGNNPVNWVDPSGLRRAMGAGRSSRSWTPPRPSAPSYNQTSAAANRARAVERVNRITRAQSQGHRQPYCF
jgi:RHS repeat-associated protein